MAAVKLLRDGRKNLEIVENKSRKRQRNVVLVFAT